MTTNKVWTQLEVQHNNADINRDFIPDDKGNMLNKKGDICGKVDSEQGTVTLYMHSEPPKNPNTGKPYFTIPDSAWSDEWVAGEITDIPSSAWGDNNE